MGDLVKGQGPFQGYAEMSYKDRSKSMTKFQGTLGIPAGKKFSTLTGKGEYIKGTGRFEGIKGTLSFSGRFITPYGKETKGDVVADVTGTYRLPSK